MGNINSSVSSRCLLFQVQGKDVGIRQLFDRQIIPLHAPAFLVFSSFFSIAVIFDSLNDGCHL